MSSDSSTTATMRTIGRYKAFGELGRGAMGVVYRGFDPVIGRTVALKTLIIDTADAQAKEFRDRLYREAAAAGALSHPNIVTIFDIVEDGSLTAIAMEFIEGRSLADIILERGPLTLEAALEVFDQICSALDYAGEHGIVHRDIKPANILITPDGKAKVTDFGVARLAISTMTQAGMVLGSPSYMSPEQVRGLPLDPRSDLFSAAVVFYEMVTRERPFTGTDVATTMYRIAHEPPTPPNTFNAAIGPTVTVVLERALAKSPDQRYRTGAEFAAELRHAITTGSTVGMGMPSMVSTVAAVLPPPVPPIVMPTPPAGVPVTMPMAPIGPTLAMPAPTLAGPGGPPPMPYAPQETVFAPASSMPALAPIGGAEMQPAPGFGGTGSGVQLPPVPGMTLPPPIAVPVTKGKGKGNKTLIYAAVGGGALLVMVLLAIVVFGGRKPAEAPAQTDATPPPAAEPAVPAAEPAVPAVPQDQAPATASSTALAPVGNQPSSSRTTVPAAPGTTVVPPPPRSSQTSGRPSPVVAAPPTQVSPPVARRVPTGPVYDPVDVDERPSVLRQIAPAYPDSAARQHLEDVVVLKVRVAPDGRADDVLVLRGSQKDKAFDTSAVAAVRQWTFTPAKKDGHAVACWFNVGVPFQLKR